MADYFPCPRYCATQKNPHHSFSSEKLCDFCWEEYCFCWAEYCLDGWLAAQASHGSVASTADTKNQTQARPL
ncbi:MAG TPA: hypothetical protein IGS40_21965 [Trichormus sp. M33_DOE_039]|nr:hypothetical protein [Trichormus sp. M33_DOE_039]